jgi:MYXO-CTERM domain-containing protein
VCDLDETPSTDDENGDTTPKGCSCAGANPSADLPGIGLLLLGLAIAWRKRSRPTP